MPTPIVHLCSSNYPTAIIPSNVRANLVAPKIVIADLMGELKVSVDESFADDAILENVRSTITPPLLAFKEALNTANVEIKSLKSQLVEKDSTVTCMTRQIEVRIQNDVLKRQLRRGAVRLFDVPGNKVDTTDSKTLDVLNDKMKIFSPILLGDLEVTHRLGKPQLFTSDDHSRSQQQKMTRLIVKFPSRHMKSRTIVRRKSLKINPCIFTVRTTYDAFIRDGFTKRRVYLDFLASQNKRLAYIIAAWIAFFKVKIMDNYGHISTANTAGNLRKFDPN